MGVSITSSFARLVSVNKGLEQVKSDELASLLIGYITEVAGLVVTPDLARLETTNVVTKVRPRTTSLVRGDFFPVLSKMKSRFCVAISSNVWTSGWT